MRKYFMTNISAKGMIKGERGNLAVDWGDWLFRGTVWMVKRTG